MTAMMRKITSDSSLWRVTVAVTAAAALWFAMFSPLTSVMFPFWSTMSVAAVVLSCLALTFGGRDSLGLRYASWRSTIFLGTVIAIVLWLLFYVGDKMSQLMFDFARTQVNLIYDMKDGTSPLLLSTLLLCLIGPAEEIFWRGYVQRTLSQHYDANVAFMATTAIYTLVHLPSANFMLVMAALTCGVVWGGLYRLFPRQLTAIILSHALWDAAAFVWFPF